MMRLNWKKWLALFLAAGLSLGQAQSHIEIPLALEERLTGPLHFFSSLEPKRVKIGLALSGGGARGLAQIGMLKVFEKNGLAIDCIAGTSIGAIIGGLYAVGYSASALDSLSRLIQWNEIIENQPPRQQLFLAQKEERDRSILQLRLRGSMLDIPSAYAGGQKLNHILTEFLLTAPYPVSTQFNELTIPFHAVATDLITGEKIVIKDGSLTDALRASMAVPILFAPVSINGYLLADGGILQNLPVSDAKEMGADIVIGIDTTSKLRDVKALHAPWEIADQVTTIMQNNVVRDQLRDADIAILPDLTGYSNTDFSNIDAIIRAGEAATEAAWPALDSLLKRSASAHEKRAYPVDTVIVEGCTSLAPEHLLALISMKTGRMIPEEELVWAGRSLWQTGDIRKIRVWADTVEKKLIFDVLENPLIREVKMTGNRIYPDSVLFHLLESRSGNLFNTHRVRHDCRSLLDKYHSDGYFMAKLDTAFLKDGVLTFQLSEGTIDHIDFRGNQHTRRFVLERELPLRPSDLFNVSSLRLGMENIYSTGYFDEVRYEVHSAGRTHSLAIHVQERGTTLLRLGLRYDLERRGQGFLEIVEQNLLGLGIDMSATGLAGNKDEMVSMRLFTHRLYTSYLNMELRLALEKRIYDYYDNFEKKGSYSLGTRSASVALGQQLRRLGALSVQLSSEEIDLLPLTGDVLSREKSVLRTVALRSEIDSRDRIPLARNGKHHVLEYETGLSLLGSTIAYSKIYSSMELFYPLGSHLCFHPQLRWGTSDKTTPFAKQFSYGGMDLFMGLPENAFLGKQFFLLNCELRAHLPLKRIESYFSLRYDFGGIWGSYVRIQFNAFNHGLGGILSVQTPLGPIQLGYGFMSESKQQFYLSAGFKF